MDHLDELVERCWKNESVASFILAAHVDKKEQAKLVARLYMRGYLMNLAYDELSDLKWKYI